MNLFNTEGLDEVPPEDGMETVQFHPSKADTMKVVSGYKLLELLGESKFGKVYRALAPGGVEVAVKKVKKPVDHQEAKYELRALELVKLKSHPYLLRIHAYFFESDHLYICMELADGDLAKLLAERRKETGGGFEAKELIRYFCEAAEALDYLHGEKVIHRDVKPANMMLLKGHMKLGDFGLARLWEEEAADLDASVVGTPIYMPPERWRGRLGFESDQYSLAAAYVELRQGRPLYSARNHTELAERIVGEPPDLSCLSLAEQEVLQRALAKDAKARFGSCTDFVNSLQEAVAPELPPISEPPRGRSRFWQIAAAVSLCMAIGLAIATRPSRNVPEGFVASADATYDHKWDGEYWASNIVRELESGADCEFVFIDPQDGRTSPFYISKYEIPAKAFAEFAKETGFEKEEWRNGPRVWATDPANRYPYPTDDFPSLPVVSVRADDAQRFAKWLGGDLPNRQQWLAATGIANREESPPLEKVAIGRPWDGPMSVETTSDDVSALGIHDLAGNVREWTIDAHETLRERAITEFADGEFNDQTEVWAAGRCYRDDLPNTSDKSYDNLVDFFSLIKKADRDDWEVVGIRVVVPLER